MIASQGMKLPALRRLRERAALSQRTLGEKAGVSYVTIARVEAGRDAMPSTANKLAKALSVKPAELMGQP